MVPILLNAASSVAGNVIDSVGEYFSQHHGVQKASKTTEDDFDAQMANAQAVAATPAAVATTPAATAPADNQGALMTQVLGSPEISTALASANPAQAVQVEMTAAGNVSLRSANGELHALKVSDHTRGLVSKLYSAHQATVTPGKAAQTAVLAVDPARRSAAAWSTLPARSA